MNAYAVEHILPKSFAKEPLPVLYNSWEATGYNVHSKGQQKLAKMAADIGCELFGVFGGVAVTFATVLPSLLIILIIAKFFDKYQDKPLVKTTFSCIRPVSAGLIAVAAWNVLSISVVNVFSPIRAVIFAVSLTLLFVWKKMSPILLIVLCGVAGVIFL